MDAEHTPAQQVLDPDAIDGLRELQEEGEPDLLAELVEMFALDGDARLEAIGAAAQEQRAVDVEREAHALKGASAVFGAEAVVELCQQLQQAGRSGDLSETPGLVVRLREEYARLRSALRDEVVRGAQK